MVDPDTIEAFYARYGEVCKAGMAAPAAGQDEEEGKGEEEEGRCWAGHHGCCAMISILRFYAVYGGLIAALVRYLRLGLSSNHLSQDTRSFHQPVRYICIFWLTSRDVNSHLQFVTSSSCLFDILFRQSDLFGCSIATSFTIF